MKNNSYDLISSNDNLFSILKFSSSVVYNHEIKSFVDQVAQLAACSTSSWLRNLFWCDLFNSSTNFFFLYIYSVEFTFNVQSTTVVLISQFLCLHFIKKKFFYLQCFNCYIVLKELNQLAIHILKRILPECVPSLCEYGVWIRHF